MSSTTAEMMNPEDQGPNDENGLCPDCGAEFTCDACWPLQDADDDDSGYGYEAEFQLHFRDYIDRLYREIGFRYYPEAPANDELDRDLEKRKFEQVQNERRRAFSILFAGITEQERKSFTARMAPKWKENPDALLHFLCTGRTDYGPSLFFW